MTNPCLHLSLAEYQLDNGLRVVICPDPIAPGVAVNIWYHVGSADELPGRSGFAHLFEHLMFQGSAQVASGEHFALLEAAGAMANATTSFDRTNYFATVPKGALELALWLEADRMNGLALTPANLEAQRKVVKEEKRQNYDNQPYGDLLELILSQHYPAMSPYGHATIGSMADLDAANADDVRSFFNTWYQPNNAVLTLTGNVSYQEGVTLAERYFSCLPAGAAPAIRPPVNDHHDPNQLYRRANVPHDVLYLSWAGPPITHPDYEILGLLLDLLTGGLSARMHRHLVKEAKVVESIGSSLIGFTRAPSIIAISARIGENQSLASAEKYLRAEIDRLATDELDPTELDRACAQAEREYLSSLEQLESRADLLSGGATYYGNPRHALGYLDRIHNLTVSDLTAVAKRYLLDYDHYTLIYEKAV